MDFTQIILAQTNSDNQFRFDAAAFERSILRQQKRRAAGRHVWKQFRSPLRQIWEAVALASKIVTQRRIS